MSKKTKNCDIYFEENDKNNVYIEVHDFTDCSFEIWDYEGKTQSRATIRIPVEVWKEMLKKWASANTKKDETYEYL